MVTPLAFGFGNPGEWLIIAVVALIVFGPKRLPEVGKQLGQALREFRKISEEFTGAASSVRDEVESVYKPVLTPPSTYHPTSSPTVEQAITHRPYDQDPEELMAPVVPKPDEAPARTGLTLSTLPPTDGDAGSTDAKGH